MDDGEGLRRDTVVVVPTDDWAQSIVAVTDRTTVVADVVKGEATTAASAGR
jgi:hypothetical protein